MGQLLGMLQYYRDLWKESSEILSLIMELTKGGPTQNGPIEWTPSFTKAFNQMKELTAKETIPTYPEF